MKIDKGIELPIIQKKPSKWAFIADMDVGDSVLVTSDIIKNPRQSSCFFYVWTRNHNRKEWRFAQRAMTEGVRVWRVK